MEEAEGDILVFLTGQDEIESMERLLKDRSVQLPPSSKVGLKLSVVSIYASMPPEQQMKVRRHGLRFLLKPITFCYRLFSPFNH